MDKTESLSNLDPKSVQRQFFQWAVKWFYANIPEDTSTKPDIPSIICLLQSVGFKLRQFERQDHLFTNENALKNDSVRITMECGASKMVAILDTDDVICECLDNFDAKGGSLWSVSGTGPAGSMNNLNKIEETGSNLLPEMSKDLTIVVRDIAFKLFKMINNKCDINQNTDRDINLSTSFRNKSIVKAPNLNEGGLVRSYTDCFQSSYKSPKVVTRKKSAPSKESIEKHSKFQKQKEEPQIKRQGTYEINDTNEILEEPRASPQKLPISPLSPDLCTSLGHISLESDDEIVGLADYVVKAHQILDKAVNFIIKKIPLNSSHSSILDDSNLLKIKPRPLRSSSFCTSPRSVDSNSIVNQSMSSIASSRPGSVCSLSTKAGMPPLNRAASMIQKSGVRSNCTPTSLPPMRNRSSSLGVTQRPVLKTPAFTNTGQITRKSSISGTGTTVGTGLAQRSVPGMSKLQSKPGSLTVGRSVTKQRISPNSKSSNSTPNAPRSNVSLIRAPSVSTRHSTGSSTTSTGKFGYSAYKK